MTGLDLRSQRGATAVLVILTLAMVLAFVGAAVNIGHLYSARGEIQNAGDAGSLAGARVLDGTATGLDAAPGVAQATGDRNPTDRSTVDVHLGDIETGNWDVVTRTFTPMSDPAQAMNINAVRVSTYRDAGHGSSVPLALGAFLGNRYTRDVAARAVAVGGPPSYIPNACMPLAVSKCDLPNLQCNHTFRITWTNDWSDSTGWVSFPPFTNVSAAIVKNEIGNCVCDGSGTGVSNGDIVNIMNGDATSACKTLKDTWSSSPANQGCEWPVPVIDAGCPTRYIQQAPVSGWVCLRITDVQCTGSPKYVDIQLVCPCDAPPGARPGGTFNQSISPVPPALVQ
jgi:hypothetical protein